MAGCGQNGENGLEFSEKLSRQRVGTSHEFSRENARKRRVSLRIYPSVCELEIIMKDDPIETFFPGVCREAHSWRILHLCKDSDARPSIASSPADDP